MTEIGYDLDLDYKEPEIVRDANPHTVKIVQAPEIRDIEVKGVPKKVVYLRLKVIDGGSENLKLVKHTLWMPSPSDGDKMQSSINQLKKFAVACGCIGSIEDKLTVGEFVSKLGSCVGAEFQATLKVEHDDTYGDSNKVKRLMV